MMTAWTNATRSGRDVVATESRTALQPIRLALASRRLLRRTSNPSTVIVLPGLAGNDASTISLRCYLQRIGHRGRRLGTRRTRPRRHGHPPRSHATARLSCPRSSHSAHRSTRHATRQRRGCTTNRAIRSSIASTHSDDADRSVYRFTTIYSRRDGVVDWRQAVDDHKSNAFNVEVGSSHIGLGVDPDVWRIIADTIDNHPTTDNSNGSPP